MITLYTLPSSTSCRKAVAYLTDMKIPFTIQQINKHHLTYEQLKEILHLTDEGLTDILANGRSLRILIDEGVDLNEITLKEFHYYVLRYPGLLRAPIAIGNNRLVVGFDEERYGAFTPRSVRMGVYNEHLLKIRIEEDGRLANKKKISAGHRGNTP